MNGIHDMGGMHGLGPVNPDPNEVIFRADWERRVFGLFVAVFAAGHMNVDEFRHAIERMDAVDYLDSTYYQHWLHSLETLLRERGVVSDDDISKRMTELSGGA